MTVHQFITKSELQARLLLHRNTIGRMLAQGRFPNAIKTGGRWRIPVQDVEAFLACHRGRSPQEDRP